MKKSIFFWIMAGATLLSTACSKDEPLTPEEVANNLLEGKWNVFFYEADDEDVFSLAEGESTFIMEYEKETEDTGDFEWTVTEPNGSGTSVTEMEFGNYEILQDGKAIHIVPMGGTDITEEVISLEVDEDELEIQGKVGKDDTFILIRAKRL